MGTKFVVGSVIGLIILSLGFLVYKERLEAIEAMKEVERLEEQKVDLLTQLEEESRKLDSISAVVDAVERERKAEEERAYEREIQLRARADSLESLVLEAVPEGSARDSVAVWIDRIRADFVERLEAQRRLYRIALLEIDALKLESAQKDVLLEGLRETLRVTESQNVELGRLANPSVFELIKRNIKPFGIVLGSGVLLGLLIK